MRGRMVIIVATLMRQSKSIVGSRSVRRMVGCSGRSGFVSMQGGRGLLSSPKNYGSRLFSSHTKKEDPVVDDRMGYKRPAVNWYPGHIAKAEKQLSEILKSVDVVIEVRDARIPQATSHPRVVEWSAGRPRIVVFTKADLVPPQLARPFIPEEAADATSNNNKEAKNRARQAFLERGKYTEKKEEADYCSVQEVLFVDAKRGGAGIRSLHKAIWKAGQFVNERRSRRGLSERPLRVGIIGYPNVGKSALINRILGRKRAKTADTPGITRTLQWIRVRSDSTNRGTQFELLDSPGIIPANLALRQTDALLLAACNCIGTASYDNQEVAANLCQRLATIHAEGNGRLASPEWRLKVKERYGFDPLIDNGSSAIMTGHDILFKVATTTCQGNSENASRKILQDFRTGRMGLIALQKQQQQQQLSNRAKSDKRIQPSFSLDRGSNTNALEQEILANDETRNERVKLAVMTARKQGVELPPNMTMEMNTKAKDEIEDVVGKGMFDGW